MKCIDPMGCCLSSLVVREARAEEFKRVVAFYLDCGYQPEIDPHDILIIAEQDAILCGALRICEEESVLVLRGVRVVEDLRRRGIGTRLLRVAGAAMGSRECFCIPHRYLVGFYGQVGFAAIDMAEAPAFLRERCTQYQREHHVDILVMRRPRNRHGT